MNRFIPFIIFLNLLIPYTSYSQFNPQVSVIGNPYKELEYKCYSDEYSYSIELPIFKITNLIYNEVYDLDLTVYEPKAFDVVTYESVPDFPPYGGYFKWPYQNISTDTIFIFLGGSYNNLDFYSSQGLRFAIRMPPEPFGDTATAVISVVSPPINISGQKLVCSNPVSFYLNGMPTSYSWATWEI